MEALQPKVGPALQASFSQVGAELVNHAVKINTLEHEVRMLKIRTAWTEKDLMYSQIEAAKRTLVVRNFPEWATAADRELTAAEALKENNLGYLECHDHGRHRWQEVAGADLLPNNPGTKEEQKAGAGEQSAGSQNNPGRASDDHPKDDDMGEESKASQPSQKVWEPSDQDVARHYAVRAPARSSTSRPDERLPAPLRALHEGVAGAEMEHSHPGGQGGCLAGKNPEQPQDLQPHRNDRHSGDWKCEVQLPAEHMDRILECWRDVWYDQLKQQISQTEVEKEAFSSASQKTNQNYVAAARLNHFLTKAVPSYNEGEESGIENWVARFKFEYHWELSFTAVSQDHPGPPVLPRRPTKPWRRK